MQGRSQLITDARVCGFVFRLRNLIRFSSCPSVVQREEPVTGRARTITILVLAVMIAPLTATAAMPSKEAAVDKRALGFWEPPDMDAIISIATCGEMLCARLVHHEYEDYAQTDVNNPDPSLRARPLQGLAIINGLRAVKNGLWRGGAFYDPRTGKTYSSKLKVLDANRVKISGCIAPRLCKGYVWTRVAPGAGASKTAEALR